MAIIEDKESYRQIEAVNQSKLKKLFTNPKMYLKEDSKETPSYFIKGSILDCLIN